MVSTMDDYNNGDAIYRSLNYGKTWTIVEQNTSGAINDVAFSPWLNFGNEELLLATAKLALRSGDRSHSIPTMRSSVPVRRFGTLRIFWLTDVNQQPVFSVGAYGSAPSGVKQVLGGSSIEETVVLRLSSPPTGAPLLSAVGDVGVLRSHDRLTRHLYWVRLPIHSSRPARA